MNTFAVLILAALLVGYLLDLLADALNLKSLRTPLPVEFSDVYDQQRYDQSQAYTRTRTRFGFVTETFGLLLILVFWFSGGFNLLDQWVRSFEFSTIVNGLLFIGILSVGQSIITLPFSIFSTFVIEERFGFNKTTARTFITDLLKGLGLSIVLGAPLLAGVLYFFESAGSYAWLYVWALITVFTLGVQYIAPTWIMPLFNKFEPLEDGELRTAIMAAADKAGFPLQGVFRIDGSKRSSRANAFFTGFGRNKRIALYDTLIEKHSTDELVNVLAHEIGHYKLRHIQTGMVAGIIQTGVMLALLQYFLTAEGLFEAFFMQEMSVYAGMLFFGMLYSPVSMILSMFMQMQSRRHEYQADAFAAKTTGQPEVMISALKKLSADNLSNLTPHPFYAFLNYSHPPVLQRIKALRDGV
jgi:STE24 endopeptidase